MPPLTTVSSDCESCSRLSLKVKELEGRISTLYQIQEDERLLDTLVLVGPAAAAVAMAELDSTVPCAGAVSPTRPADPWTLLGARPKAPVSSTPNPQEQWTRVCHPKRHKKSFSQSPPLQDIQLSNRFDVLNEQDFPPLSGHLQPVGSALRSEVTGPVQVMAKSNPACEHIKVPHYLPSPLRIGAP